ncbi:MAG: hypothetical protein WCH83_00840 [Alphaproteobacteria bacterium]
MTLHIWNDFWDLRVKECPCDAHFCDYLDENNVTGKSIFHFGTGGHHLLGLHNVEKGLNNAILGITAAPGEHKTYETMIIENPELGWGYKVFFGDIYQLDARLLPMFDIVTLFHVGEFRTEKNDVYGALTDYQMVKLLAGQTRPGGLIAFYAGSYAYNLAKPIHDQLVEEGYLTPKGQYKTLPLFERTAKAV